MPTPPDFKPRKITDAQAKELDAFVTEHLGDREVAEQILAQIEPVFIDGDAKQDLQYKHTFLRWYIEFSWAHFNDHEYQWVAKVAVGRHAPLALMMGYDVWQKVVKYFVSRTYRNDDLEDVYEQIKKYFLESSAVLGTEKGKEVTLSSIVQEVQRAEQRNEDSLALAKLRGRIRDLLYADVPSHLANDSYEDAELVAQELLGLIRFFIGIDTENIFYVVDAFLRPNLYVDGGAAVSASVQTNSPQEKTAQKESIKPPSAAPAAPVQPELKKEERKPQQSSLQDIKKMIEERFHPNADGQFDNIEGVLMLLDNLAEEKGDERVRELYYFDEDTGTFHWNQDLLKE